MRKYSDPLLFAVMVFAEYFWNVTPANSEGRLYVEKAAKMMLVQKRRAFDIDVHQHFTSSFCADKKNCT